MRPGDWAGWWIFPAIPFVIGGVGLFLLGAWIF